MKYDLIVIGGGPAGMMAAGAAGEKGARVLLLEKNRSLGLKLLLTGNGRCNLTNFSEEAGLFAKRFGPNGKFLLSALARFSPQDAVDFFKARGVKIKIEDNGRVFPESDRAREVLAALNLYLEDFKVKVRNGAAVARLVKNGNRIEKIILENGEELLADKFLIATGGKSYPLTGSTGDAYAWLKEIGHKIVEPRPALVEILVKEKISEKLEGASLGEAVVSFYQGYKKAAEESGGVMFTGGGLTGPAIINLSRRIAHLKMGGLSLRIDSVPSLSFAALDKKMEKDLPEAGTQMIKNYLNEFWPPKMILPLLAEAKIDSEKKCRDIGRVERKALARLLKELSFGIKSLGGWGKAVITAGGADLSQIDPKTMKSRIIDNLYLAGEVLDLDGPTGGYNLQVCWSTGYVGGGSAV